MKIIVCLFGLCALSFARPGVDRYTDRYDNIDLDEILSNRRLLIPYIKCILDQGKCSPDGKELKSHIKEALENDCAKCRPNQREGARKVLSHFINKENDYWVQLIAKYDPQRKYTVTLEKELRTTSA